MFPPTAVISFTNHIQQHSTSNSDQYLLFCFNQFENNVSVPPALKFLRRCPLVMIFQYLRRQEYCKSTHTIFEKSKVQSADVMQNFWYLLKLHTNNCRNSVLKFGWWKLPHVWVSWVKLCLSYITLKTCIVRFSKSKIITARMWKNL